MLIPEFQFSSGDPLLDKRFKELEIFNECKRMENTVEKSHGIIPEESLVAFLYSKHTDRRDRHSPLSITPRFSRLYSQIHLPGIVG